MPPLQERPLTPREYEWLVEHAWTSFGELLEYWDGVLVGEAGAGYDREPPRHDDVVAQLIMILAPAVVGRHVVRARSRFDVGGGVYVQPDLAVVPVGSPTPPQTAPLVAEVTATSHHRDLRDKAGLYAAAGVEEYWCADLAADAVHVHRDPHGWRYRAITTHRPPEVLHALGVAVDLGTLFAG